jgi:hypothetical protein
MLKAASFFYVEYIYGFVKAWVARFNVTLARPEDATNNMTERVTIATPYTQQHGRSANHDQ